MRGVAFRVPQVMSCFTAAGPSSEGVGDGIVGTREKLFIVGDLGRSDEQLRQYRIRERRVDQTYMEYQRWLHLFDFELGLEVQICCGSLWTLLVVDECCRV